MSENAAHGASAPAEKPAPRAARSTLITLGGNAASQVLRLASNLLLTRLLVPEAFGLMAIVITVMQGLQLVSDVGIIPSVIHHKRGDDPAFLDTAWSLSAIRGLVLFAAAWLLAWPMAQLYEQPEIAWLVPVVAISSLLTGLESPRVALAWRHMQNGRIVLLDLGQQLAAFVVNISVAYATRSVWALVAGIVTSQLLRTVATHVLLPGPRARFRFDRDAVASLLSFGRWVLLSTLITYFATRLDVLLLGKLLPIEVLGVYSLATMVATLPSVLIGAVLGSVVTPLLARAHREGSDELARAFTKTRGLVLPAAAFATLATALSAPGFFGLLYDHRYADAMWIAPLLMLSALWTCLQEASTRVFVATGDAKPLVPSNLARLVVSSSGALVGHAVWQLPGFIVGQALGALVGFIYLDIVLGRRGLHALKGDLLWSGVTIVIGGASAAATHFGATASDLPEVWVSIAVGVCVLAAFAAAVGPRAWRSYRMRAA